MGRYYDEAIMGPVRVGLEHLVAGWRGVRAGQMFGCPCYYADDKMFAFVATGGIVLSQLDGGDRDRLAAEFGAGPFAPRPGRAATKWSHTPTRRADELKRLVPWRRRSYEVARAFAKSTRTTARKPASKRARRSG